MKTLYYKVKIGFGQDDYISITKDELEKATYAFITKADVVFENGVCQGKHIMAISPDYHRTMGWNQSYKLGAEDYADVTQKIGNPLKYIAEAKSNVDYYIDTRQEHLIGSKPLEIALKVAGNPKLDGSASLADQMRISN